MERSETERNFRTLGSLPKFRFAALSELGLTGLKDEPGLTIKDSKTILNLKMPYE